MYKYHDTIYDTNYAFYVYHWATGKISMYGKVCHTLETVNQLHPFALLKNEEHDLLFAHNR